MKGLLLFGESRQNESKAEKQPRNYLPEIASRRSNEAEALAIKVCHAQSEYFLAWSGLPRRTLKCGEIKPADQLNQKQQCRGLRAIPSVKLPSVLDGGSDVIVSEDGPENRDSQDETERGRIQ